MFADDRSWLTTHGDVLADVCSGSGLVMQSGYIVGACCLMMWFGHAVRRRCCLVLLFDDGIGDVVSDVV